jgi:multimeric flavodoxin WrbA
MTTRITVFNSSPRKENGVTHLMAEQFLEGARAAGAETDHILLADKKIRHCIGCFSCWFKTPGVCVFKDDEAELLRLYMASDIVVLAGPVYVGSVCGIMKDFIDRMLPLYDPHFGCDEQGRFYHLSRYDHCPDIVAMANCGLPSQHHFSFYRQILEFMKEVYRINLIAEIYCGGGFILKGYIPEVQSKVDAYMDLLDQCGREIVNARTLSPQTQAALVEPFIDIEQGVETSNQVVDALLEGIEKK